MKRDAGALYMGTEKPGKIGQALVDDWIRTE
jgi:hypothetical protein